MIIQKKLYKSKGYIFILPYDAFFKKKKIILLHDSQISKCFHKDQKWILLTLNVKKLKKFGNGSLSPFSFSVKKKKNP